MTSTNSSKSCATSTTLPSLDQIAAAFIEYRGEALVATGWPADSPEGSVHREFEATARDALETPPPLLWTASG